MGINAVLNAVKTISSVIFPLITFPYISRVLHVNNMGIYNFSASIVSYFTLLAGLGISTYAIREGARYREDKEKMSKFSSEVFTINVVSTIISYILLFLCVSFIPGLSKNSSIIYILSIAIFFTTIGCEWVFNIYEDFAFITIRSIIFQFISLGLMFIFVKNKSDLKQYAAIIVLSSSGANIINAISRRKYCKTRLSFSKSTLYHLKPILILFANSIAMTIYINSDNTMIGALAGAYYTGLYAVSTKVYTMVKTLIGALIVVAIPRLASLLGKNKNDKFQDTANTIFGSLITVVVPAMVGVFMLSKDIVLILSGKEYIASTLSLQILSIALLFSIFSWFYQSCILIPNREDKTVLMATTLAAIINLFLNFILIPFWKHNAAALTTGIAEFVSAFISYIFARKYFTYNTKPKNHISIVLGCIGIIIICLLIDYLELSLIFDALFKIIFSIFSYFLVLKLMKNRSLEYLESNIKKKI